MASTSGLQDRARVRPRDEPPVREGPEPPETRLREGIYRRTLALADAVVAAVVVLVVLPLVADPAPLTALGAVPLLVLVDKVVGLYDRDELVMRKSTLDEAPVLVQISGLFSLLLWLVLDAWSAIELDASDVVAVWTAMSALLLLARTCARATARALAGTERVLVVGEPASIAGVREKLAGARIDAAVVATLELGPEPAPDLAAALRTRVHEHHVQRVIVAPAPGGSAETVDLVRVAKHAGVHVSVLPRLLEVVGSSVAFDDLDGLTVLGVRRFGLSRSSHLLKRSFDLAGGVLLLILVAPVLAAVWLAVKLDDGGPLLFRQTRVGRDGRRFEIVKFRSMIVDAEQRKDELRHLNETVGLFKIAADPRVTRVGRFLRRTSLDELPQLLNVVRGEMSLVGPRPLVVDEDALVHGYDRHRLHLTPGMTGHWQILGPTRVPMHEMVGIDYLYVANWSLWTDVKILLRTVPHLVARRGM